MKMIIRNDGSGTIDAIGALLTGIDLEGLDLPTDFVENAIHGKYKWRDNKAIEVDGWTMPVPPEPKPEQPSLAQQLAEVRAELAALKIEQAAVKLSVAELKKP